MWLVKIEIKVQLSEMVMLKKVVVNKNYIVNNMYMKVNLYGVFLLFVKVIFQMSKVVKVSYMVVGKSSKILIFNMVNKYIMSYDLIVLGLYVNMNNQVKIKVIYKDGMLMIKMI